jgi:hypothetical protein
MVWTMDERLLRWLVASIVAAGVAFPAFRLAASPAGPSPVYDNLSSSGTCRVSSDGYVWYALTPGAFSPLQVKASDCGSSALGVVPAPVPGWAKPTGPTQAVFSAVSLVEKPHGGPIEPLAETAHEAGVPLTYLLGWDWIPSNVPVIDAEHARGDDVQVVPSNLALARGAWKWFVPSVSVLGGSMERRIDLTLAGHLGSFWGITWNSNGVDGVHDRGAPWGLYCADPRSYKRPDPDGHCDLAGIEWTARDLTMAYESGREDAYSTDPDDVRLRAKLAPEAAAQYERELVDAYAAAGQSTPLLMIAEEEPNEFSEALAYDRPVELALYEQARRDGMEVTTLANAVRRLVPSAAQPRVVAFPALASSGRYGPATIDAHDEHVALTFTAANLMPDRVFEYDRAPTSSIDRNIPQLSAGEMPRLQSVSADHGIVTLRFWAPVATDFGVAFWVAPTTAGWTSPNVIPAGRAGAVALFDLVRGDNTVTLGCRTCNSDTFPYAGT